MSRPRWLASPRRPAGVVLVGAILVAATTFAALLALRPNETSLARPLPRAEAPSTVVPDGSAWGSVDYPVNGSGYTQAGPTRVQVDIIDESGSLADYTPRGTPPAHPSTALGAVAVVNASDDPKSLWVLWYSCPAEQVHRIVVDSGRQQVEVISPGCGADFGSHTRQLRLTFRGFVPPASDIITMHTTFPTLETLPEPT